MNEFKLIGLHGYIGSGKSTVAKYLHDFHDFTILSLAEPLKFLVKKLFNLSFSCVQGTQKDKSMIIENLGVSGRELLQVIGTELFRETIHEKLPNLKIEKGKLWLWKAEQQLLYYKQNGYKGVVIDDIRFENEIDWIHGLNGITIYIERENENKSNHKSEQNLKEKCMFSIDNYYNLDILFYSIRNIIDKLH